MQNSHILWRLPFVKLPHKWRKISQNIKKPDKRPHYQNGLLPGTKIFGDWLHIF
jgi:hypothetical protein